MVLALDFGGVVVDRHSPVSFFSDSFLDASEVAGCFDALRRLSERYELHVVSCCGERVQERSLQWLAYHRFYERCSVAPEHVHFVRQRQEKVAVCEELSAVAFVDDRLEVLGYLSDVVPQRFLFDPQERELSRFRQHLSGVSLVSEWAEVESQL